MLQGAGNLLIRRAVLEEMTAPWFDPQFALSGGEDQDFFMRLKRAGKRFAWCDEARAHGDVPDAAPIWAGCCAGPIRWAIPTCGCC